MGNEVKFVAGRQMHVLFYNYFDTC